VLQIAGLIVLTPLALLLARRFGDLMPMLTFFAVAALDIFAAPAWPGSPDACLDSRAGCTGHLTGVGWLVLGIPLAVAMGIKMLRGDRRTGVSR